MEWQISLPSLILQIVKFQSFHIPEAWKGTPFRQSLPQGGYSGFQVTGMIKGFFGFEIFDSGIFWGSLIRVGIFWGY